ncbi:MAG: glycosyltransferase family 9 protein [candidate division WOR-3 bacterium]
MDRMINKVLIIRLSSLGDIVIATSLVEFLYRVGVRIHFAVYDEFAELFEEDPRIEKVIRIKRDIGGKIDGLRAVRSEKYDLVVDLHRKLYPALLTCLAKTRKRAACEKRSLERRLAVIFKKKIEEYPLYKLYVESVKKYFELEDIPYPKLLSFKKPNFELPEEYIVFVPGASKKTKAWPIDYYIKLGNLLYESFGLPILLVGKDIMVKSLPQGFLNLQSSTSLRELLYILKNAKFVVSNDTGPAHMTAAVGTPLFVIFGPTIPEFGFRPAGDGFIKIIEKKLPCRPCSPHGLDRCPLEHWKCMLEVKPEEVFVEIERYYSRRTH